MSLQSDYPVRESAISDNVIMKVGGLAALNRMVWDRRAEYTTLRQLRIKIGTWNVAAIQGTEKDVAGWFIQGKGITENFSGMQNAPRIPDPEQQVESINDQESRVSSDLSTLPRNGPLYLEDDANIGIYALGLQEIVDVSSPTETLRPYHDREPSERWKSAVFSALPKGYSLVAEQQLVGMYILIFADKHVAESVSNVSCKFVGTGVMGYMGNKGAVSVRIVLGEVTKLVFINSHLAAGAQAQSVDRRNWDAGQVVARTRFAAIDRGYGVVDEVGDSIGDEDFAFWFGDLNYRLADLPGEEIRNLLTRHAKMEYEKDAAAHERAISPNNLPKLANEDGLQQPDQCSSREMSVDVLDPDENPDSLETTLTSLLPHDELGDQIKKHKAFHQGWREGKIRFMPTYKYDVGSVGNFDTSEKRRAPSWCDRILYRSRQDYISHEKGTDILNNSNGSRVSKEDSNQVTVAFDYDPDNDAYDSEDGKDDTSESTHVRDKTVTSQHNAPGVKVVYYTSHQRVLSSDHKPLVAVFEISYTAVDNDRKAATYREIARDFDRRENELRPSLSVAVDALEGKSSHELVDFEQVEFGERKLRTLTVANTGQVDATFGFVMHDHLGSIRQWLHIDCGHQPSPDLSIPDVQDVFRIAPGDVWIATVTFFVNEPTVAQAMRDWSEEILILRVLDGRDYFLTLRGKWQNTTLGLSIEDLIRLPEGGIRTTDSSQEVKCSAPRELFRLTEALESNLERAIAEWSMKGSYDKPNPWEASAWPFTNGIWLPTDARADELVREAQNLLDSYQPIQILGLDSLQMTELLGQLLIRFLDNLQDGVITQAMWARMRDHMIAMEKIKKPTEKDYNEQYVYILEVIAVSTPHNISFQLIMSMLHRITIEISMSEAHGFLGEGDASQNIEERLKRRYAQAFQGIIFRSRAGEERHSGKEEQRNEVRRTAILELCMSERATPS